MSISINRGFALTTNHLLLDDQGLTITAFGYEMSWLSSGVRENDGSYLFEREFCIERLSDHSSWNWSKRHGRWTVREDGSIVDGWV
jgi:hypothetical protein